MKRIVGILVLGLALIYTGALLSPAEAQPATSGHQQVPVALSCTDAGATQTFAFTPTALLVKNDINSANEVYILLGTSTAPTTSTGARYEPGDGIALGGTSAGWLGVRCITATGETATLYGHAIK